MTQELLAELTRLSEKYPDLRLCQLIGNSIPVDEAQRRNNDIYYIEDDQLLQWLRRYEARVDKVGLGCCGTGPFVEEG